MPSGPRRVCVSHILGGGLATDRGNGVDTPVGLSSKGNGQIVVPFLLRAENIEYTLNGGFQKIGGTTKYNSVAINSGEEIRYMFDLTVQGTSGSQTTKMLAFAGANVYADSNNGTFSAISTAFTDNCIPHVSMYGDVAILMSDLDSPRKYDGTTEAALGGTPPNISFGVEHARKFFGAGVDANPDTLYYSDTDDAENWSTGDSGSLTVSPGDGDRITGLWSFMDRLIIFKGPNKGSIHVLEGLASADFDLRVLARGIGSVNQNLIFPYGNDIGFVWADGTIRTLRTTERFGNFEVGSLSLDIDNGIMSNITTSSLKKGVAANLPQKGRVYFTLPVQANTTPNLLLSMDYRFMESEGRPRFSTLTLTEPFSVVRKTDPNDTNRDALYLGGSDGFIRKLHGSNYNIDGGATAISAYARLPYMSYGQPFYTKHLAGVGAGIVAKGDYNSTIGWIRDSGSEQTASLDQAGTATLDVFTLDAGTLSGADYGHRVTETPEGGDFRYITAEIRDTVVNQGLEVHSIDLLIEFLERENLEVPA